MTAVLSAKDKKIPLQIRGADGTIENVSLAAEQLPGAQIRGFGIQRAYTLKVAKLPAQDANLLFVTTGLKPGDTVKAVAGVEVKNNWDIEPIIENVFEPNIAILAQRRDLSGQDSIIEGRVSLNFAPAKDFV